MTDVNSEVGYAMGSRRPLEDRWAYGVKEDFYQFQIKDEIKAARIEATQAYRQYVEEPKTSQRR